jgi:hypothetical protein
MNDLKIDISDPADVARKLPALRRSYELKLKERNLLSGQLKLLAHLIEAATAIEGTSKNQSSVISPTPSKRRRRTAPAQERAIRALEAAGGLAMSPTSLYKFMVDKGLDAPKDANVLGANLWDAWKAGRLMRAPNGVYTPLDDSGRTEWDRPLTDYYRASEFGFPAP